MRGSIRTEEVCRCGGKFQESSKGLRCPECRGAPERVFIDFSWKGERLRIFTDKEGHPFTSYEAASRFLTVMRAKEDDHTFDLREYVKVEVKGLQFENYAATWLSRREKEVERGHLSREYLRTTRVYVNRYLIPFFGKRSLRDLQEGSIEDFRDQLPVHLKGKTVYNIMGILQKMLADAHRRRDINRMPALPTIPVPDPETKWIGKNDQERILAEIQDPLRRAFFLFLMETGCRPGEARALKWDRVQLQIGKVVIAAGMDQGIYKDHTKERDVRIIPLAPTLQQALLALPKGTPGSFVFTFKGKPFTYKLIWRTWRKAAQAAGVDVCMYQGTRHSIASQAINCGIPLEVIGGMLGHKSRASTTRYAHMNDETLKMMLNRTGQVAEDGPAVTGQSGSNSKGKVLKFKRK